MSHRNYSAISRYVNQLKESSDSNFNDILDIFDDYYRKGKKLQMAFVTKGGKPTNELVGIIVANDLVKVRR